MCSLYVGDIFSLLIFFAMQFIKNFSNFFLTYKKRPEEGVGFCEILLWKTHCWYKTHSMWCFWGSIFMLNCNLVFNLMIHWNVLVMFLWWKRQVCAIEIEWWQEGTGDWFKMLANFHFIGSFLILHFISI